MFQTWQLQEAKNHFSEVVEHAVTRGPQIITKRGAEVVVLLSYAEYRKLVARQRTRSVATFFRESPLARIALVLKRDHSPARPEPKL
ncbi:MAG: type II toxin-antitoxin system Phd/YefM family antitoxin [Chloroflexi bacterium]|nr:type II toxin-antitoxin system Phd/YefM family antitoxin [Chloroflexota bacterium]